MERIKLKGRELGIFATLKTGVLAPIAHATSAELNVSRSMIEVCAGTASLVKAYLPGLIEWTATAEGVVSYWKKTSDGEELETPAATLMVAKLSLGSLVDLYIGQCVRVEAYAGEDAYGTQQQVKDQLLYCTGKAYVESVRQTGEVNGYAKYTVKFRGSGALIPGSYT
jgi:hypothetical protein